MAKYYKYLDGTFKPVGRGKPPRDAIVVDLMETPSNLRAETSPQTPEIEPQATQVVTEGSNPIPAPKTELSPFGRNPELHKVSAEEMDKLQNGKPLVPLATTLPRFTIEKAWLMENGKPVRELTQTEIEQL